MDEAERQVRNANAANWKAAGDVSIAAQIAYRAGWDDSHSYAKRDPEMRYVRVKRAESLWRSMSPFVILFIVSLGVLVRALGEGSVLWGAFAGFCIGLSSVMIGYVIYFRDKLVL